MASTRPNTQRLALPYLPLSAGAVLLMTISFAGRSAELPVPCAFGNCAGVNSWLGSGNASAVVNGSTLQINQTSDRAILNWQSFNISADGKVIFAQPSATSIALNRIFQNSPSSIFGTLSANGEVYLINQNGFVFGSTAKVNVGGLLASSLNLSDDNFSTGLLSSDLVLKGLPALESDGRTAVLDSAGQPVLGSDGQPLKVRIVVEAGSELKTDTTGSRIMLASRDIDNSGSLSAPEGQIILAAGEKLYLQSSADSSLRGLLVEVDGGGTVWNRLSGSLNTPHGNISLVGLAVNQDGRASATTSVQANGSIRLVAADTVQANNGVYSNTRGGSLALGTTGVTSVLPDEDAATAVDDQTQPKSTIDLIGKQVVLKGGSKVLAPGGTLNVFAASDPSVTSFSSGDPDARIRVDAGALIDLSGASVTAPVTRNLVSSELRANQLKDSPDQRNGALRGKTVVVDARAANGKGTTIADVSGDIALIGRTVSERLGSGGTAVFNSAGEVGIANGATIDVSGGAVDYTGGIMQTSQLIAADGSLVDISKAVETATYLGVVNSGTKVVSDKWGVTSIVAGPTTGRYEPGYQQGQAAGTVRFTGSSLYLGGTLLADTVAGPYQRTVDTRPAGGQIVVGDPASSTGNLRAPALVLGSVPAMTLDDAIALPGEPARIPMTSLRDNGFTRFQFASVDSIVLPEGSPLELTSGSSLAVTAPSISLNSSVFAPSGTLRFETGGATTANGPLPGIFLADGIGIDVGGTWTNDLPLLNTTLPLDPVFPNAGSIVFRQTLNQGTLSIGSNVSLSANGGAAYSATGTLTAGRGGAISLLESGIEGIFRIGSGGKLSAFGVNGSAGGSFALQAPRLRISDDQTQWGDVPGWTPGGQIAYTANPASILPQTLNISSALFGRSGFSSFSLTADGRPVLAADSSPQSVLTVSSNSTIDLRTWTQMLDTAAANRPAAKNITGLAQLQMLPDYLRGPETLLLSSTGAPPTGTSTSVGGLSVETGASIVADAGSSVTLATSGSRLDFSGSISAPAGTVALQLRAPGVDPGFVPDQAITIGSSASIDVSGRAVLQPSDLGLLKGKVLDGGSISLQAARGSVNVLAGASLDFSGTQAPLDLPSTASPSGYERAVVASGAGALQIVAPESISLLGTLHGAAGAGTTGSANGGTLDVELTRLNGFSPGATGDTFPTDPRIVRLDTWDPGLVQPAISGSLVLGQQQLSGSGIDALKVVADGRIQIADGFSLNLARSLVLETPAIALDPQGSASLRATYVALGTGAVRGGYVVATPTIGTGALTVSGGLIDLIGFTSLQGMGSLSLLSDSDIRLQGNQAATGSIGGLSMAGDLTLRASRIYPSTGTTFSIALAGGTSNDLRIQQASSTSGPLLSAAGALNFQADRIFQGGTVVAPFGTIALNGSQLVSLENGSLTSVSGAGAIIPYGRVDNGTSWLYAVNEGLALTSPVSATPQRTVSISAPSVQGSAGSTLDLSGGGDLYAYQWVPGTGGSKDALSAAVSPNLFAILPALGSAFAPLDPFWYSGSNLTPGSSIYLAGSNSLGLAAGNYALLPARYALLPGAYLVSAASGFQDLVPGQVGNAAGAQVIAGRLNFAGTGIGSTRYNGYIVRPGSYGRELAQYTDFKAGSFFGEKGPVPQPVALQLPADAARLSLDVSQVLALGGTLKSTPATGGRRVEVEVVAPNLEITGSGGASTAGAVQLSGSTLTLWNASRLILGGHRNGVGSDSIAVASDTVTVRNGAILTADDLIAVAGSGITVEPGAVVRSSSAASNAGPPSVPLADKPSVLSLTGAAAPAAAVLAVSDKAYYTFDRAAGASMVSGTVTLQSGSTVASRGAVEVDAPGGGHLADDAIQGAGASWSLGASRIILSDDTSAADALTLDTALLARAQSAASLNLRSASAIDIAMPVTLDAGLRKLSIDAPALRATAPGAVLFAADRITLAAGSAIATASMPLLGSSLQFRAHELDVGNGTVAVSGFDNVNVSVDGAVVGTGIGGLNVQNGTLNVSAPVITVASGADLSLISAGALNLESATAAQTAAYTPGGAVRLTGTSIVDAIRIVAPSGLVSLNATGDITLAPSAVIDVAGRAVEVNGVTRNPSGGAIAIAASGNFSAQSGARLDVSGIEDSDAGRIDVKAGSGATFDAALNGESGAGGRGASFTLGAGTLANFDTLNAALESAGFTEQRNVRVNSGDLVVASGRKITAHDVQLIADSGTIRVDGAIDATNDRGAGNIELYAGGDLTVGATGLLKADAAGSQTHAGDILLASKNGQVSLDSGTHISAVGSTESGRLILRAKATANDLNIAQLPADLSHVSEVDLQPVLAFTATAAPTAANFNTIFNSVSTYATGAGGVFTRLAPAATNVHLQPFIDITRNGDLTLPVFDLSGRRFGGEAAVLSVRASGALTLGGSITDGFTSAVSDDFGYSYLEPQAGRSSSLLFTAGADLASAAPIATLSNAQSDLSLRANVIVRTGTGSIDLSAARDVLFANGSRVFTGGLAAAPTLLTANQGVYTYLDMGGGVRLTAGRDIVGSSTSQSATTWINRQGLGQATWGINAQQFAWNVGTLGGGDIRMTSGRDISNVSAAAAGTATWTSPTQLSMFGGGNVALRAARDINSSYVYADRGYGSLVAGGALGSARRTGTTDLGTLLLMGDSQISVRARGDVLLEGISNVMMLGQPTPPLDNNFFLTYGATSSLDVESSGGKVSLFNSLARQASFIGNAARNNTNAVAAGIYPGSLSLVSFGGDIALNGTMTLFPTADGQLDLFAVRDILGGGGGLRMSDSFAATLATPSNALHSPFDVVTGAIATSQGLRHADDPLPVSLIAGRDLSNLSLNLSKRLDLIAGRDIVDLGFNGQNLHATDISRISAGRDLYFVTNATSREMRLAGPGSLQILAGRNIDLGYSTGITTTGALQNQALPAGEGADVVVMAGLNAPLDAQRFEHDIVSGNSRYRQMLIDYVNGRNGTNYTSYTDALPAFQGYDDTTRRKLLLDVFFDALVASGREANTDSDVGFKNGYAAIDALFPQSRTAASPYAGDLTMAFSRIYTLDGGGISLLAPGGLLNVGLANPPPDLGLTKAASDLGIVTDGSGNVHVFTRGDVLVNQSRIFTLGGGDIAIWSNLGDIDAGRGAKTAISAPPPTITVDASGRVRVDFSSAVAGSGIRTITTSATTHPGDVDLIAPEGFVNAGDAGIGSAGNLNVAAQTVLGLDNIQVGGVSTGVPPESSGIGASLSGAAGASNGASNSASSSVANSATTSQSTTPLAASALSWLDVFVMGLGEEVCRQDDMECLRRQRPAQP